MKYHLAITHDFAPETDRDIQSISMYPGFQLGVRQPGKGFSRLEFVVEADSLEEAEEKLLASLIVDDLEARPAEEDEIAEFELRKSAESARKARITAVINKHRENGTL